MKTPFHLLGLPLGLAWLTLTPVSGSAQGASNAALPPQPLPLETQPAPEDAAGFIAPLLLTSPGPWLDGASGTGPASTDAPGPPPVSTPVWTALGPMPIPNGQTQGRDDPVSGRVTAIEIHPTNPNIVYVGTAQGGVYRSLNGGLNWTAIFDGADSLAIGALALAPSDPTILYVGTGEANGSADSYAGVGLYRVDHADTTANLVGPINPVRHYLDAASNPQSVPVFNGRSIAKIVVHPAQPGTVFVGTAGGVIGMSASAPFLGTVPQLSLRGLWRSLNADGPLASITFSRIKVSTSAGGFDNPNTGNRNINDIVMDPTDASGNTLVVWQNGVNTVGDGGVWRSVNAMAADPTTVAFTQTFATTATSPSTGRAVFSHYQEGANPTVIYVASGESGSGTTCGSSSQQGALRRSTDGGITWSAKLPGGGGFAGGQGFYNIGMAVTPGATTATTDDIVHLGGNVSSSSCTRLHALSTDGGATFQNHDTGLHADTHAIAVAPSNPLVVFHGNDGGIWKSTDGGLTWTCLNNNEFSATQFESLALHPTDRNFMIGGTQDNGTEWMKSDGTWTRADFGDGGFALIDQNAPDTTQVTMYHTYFNQTGGIIGFGRVTDVANAHDGGWSTFGAGLVADDPDDPDAVPQEAIANGIGLSDSVLFYAPMTLGPGNPNTLYFGTDRLYRSTDRGATMVVVSQAPLSTGNPISAIGISPQNDSVRIVGLVNGKVFATTTGSSTMTDVTGSIPARYITRAIIDPNNANTAYVALGGDTLAAGAHVWKTTTLSSGGGGWAASGAGIPDVPVNALVVDPSDSMHVYAGTDIGVYASADGGATWSRFGTGMPRVAVFGMAIQNLHRVLRVATHGRGIYEATLTTLEVAGFPSPALAGAAGSFTVTAKDAFGNTDPGYVGTVHFTSSDGAATLPGNYTFTAGDLGTHTFTSGATFHTAGTQSLTATDTGNSSITGTQSGISVLSADYTVTTTGNAIVVTDVSGNSDTLTVSEPSAGNIKFATTPSTRTFSVDGGAPILGDSGNLSLAGINSITVNAGAGNDTINVGAFAGTLPNLTLNGGTGNDTVNFNGDLTFVAGANLDVDLQNDDPTPGVDTVNVAANANLKTSGSGTITVKCSRNVVLDSGSSLEAVDGNLTVEANQQATPTAGNFTGVFVFGVIQATGTGLVTVNGKGGDDPGGLQVGVYVGGGGDIIGGTTGQLTVRGTGGASLGSFNSGVELEDAGSMITSGGADVQVSGVGGGAGSGQANYGVYLGLGASVQVANSTLSVIGTAGVGNFGHGVVLSYDSDTSVLATSSGSITINATGNGSNVEFYNEAGAGISHTIGGPTATGPITIIANNANLGTASGVSIRTSGTATVRQRTNGRPIDLGGNDVLGGTPTLGLTDAELDRVTAGTLAIGDANTGPITVTAPISPAGTANLRLVTPGTIADIYTGGTDVTVASLTSSGTLSPGASPGIFSVAGNHTFAANSAFTVEIGGTTPGNGAGFHDQLNATGSVTLGANVTLNLASFGGFVPGGSQSFTIISRTGGTGAFAGLPEGATVSANFLGSGLPARISYVGGTGDDVVLTVAEAHSLVVTTTSDVVDAYDNLTSLREAIAYANTLSGPHNVTFDPTVFASPQTITLATAELPITGEVNILGPGPENLTVMRSAAPATPSFRLFTISNPNVQAQIAGLTLRNGNANDGGAIRNIGRLTVSGCLLSGNRATANGGGGIFNLGWLKAEDSTFASNSAPFAGGGLLQINGGTSVVSRCTFVSNRAGQGGAVANQGTSVRALMTFTNCTMSENVGTNGWGGVENISSGADTAMFLEGCTVANNVGSYGGIGNGRNSAVATLTFGNTIVFGHTGGDLSDYGGVGLISDGHNLIGNTTGFSPYQPTDLLNLDPLLSPLANNGGLTFTHALLPGSPAINAGTATGAPTTDQRGKSRVGTVDIGAVESQGYTLTAASGTPQSAVVSSAFANPLVVSVAANDPNDPVNGGMVTFTAPGSGASATLATSPATISGGQASVTATANATRGAYAVTAAANGASGSPSFSLTNIETPSLTVTTTADVVNNLDGLTSLREAIAYANTLSGPHNVTFDATVFALPQTITLATAELPITGEVNILGPGPEYLTVMRSLAGGTPAFRIFTNSSSGASISGLTISNGLILANGLGEIFGGGLANFGTLTLSNCVVSGNAVVTSIVPSAAYEALGGGLYNGPGHTATVVDCTFRDNSVIAQGTMAVNYEAKGGGVFNDGGTLRLWNCTLNANLAVSTNGDTGFALGGGVGQDGGTTAMTNCTVSGNTAIATNAPFGNTAEGGGIGTESGGIFLSQVTVVSNQVSALTIAAGGGIYKSPASSVSVQGSLIAGNRGTTGPDVSGTFVSGGHNLLGVSAPATGWVASDLTGSVGSPLNAVLGPLANNGGATYTHALLAGSPALDGGNNTGAAGLTTDQRGSGFPRIFHGTVDIGAYESQGIAPLITCPADISSNNVPGLCSASVAFTNIVTGFPAPDVLCTLGGLPITSPYDFPVGTSTVTCTATNALGTNTCSFLVTVHDTQPPVLIQGGIAARYTDAAVAAAAAIAATTAVNNCPGTVTKTATVSGNCNAVITVTFTDAVGNAASVTYTTRIDSTPPVLGTITATQNAATVKNCSASVHQGTGSGAVLFTVQANDNCQLAAPPTLGLTNGAAGASAVYDSESPAGTFHYHWDVTPATANGTWTATATASDGALVTTATFTLCVVQPQITGLVQLQGFTGNGTSPLHTRTVTFVATTNNPTFGTNVLKTWVLTLSNVSGDTFAYVLTGVPLNANGLSAKTDWTLRRKQACALDGNGQAVVNFTGASGRLPGGDLNGNNTVSSGDYVLLSGAWLTPDPTADIDGSGGVGSNDYNLLSGNWFTAGDPQ